MRENMPHTQSVPPQVFQELKALEQQVIQGGNVDSEINTLHHIEEELLLHHMTPEEALAAAYTLVNSRQQYH